MPAGRIAPLIGRQPELDALDDARHRALAGGASVVLLGGEAGIGKTRLTRELTDRATADDWLVLTGGCLDVGDGALPLAPMVEILRSLPQRLGPDLTDSILGTWRAELAELVPSLAQPDDGPTPGGLLADGFGRLLEILLAVFRRLADDRPTLVIVEDLHWADQSTRDLLAFLSRNLTEERLLLVVTFRTDELHRRHPLRPLLADLQRSTESLRLDLDRLTRRELDQFLRELTGAPVPTDMEDQVWDRSEGNPFFAEELVATGGECHDLPPTIEDVLLARVDAVSSEAAAVLGVAAVIGRTTEHAVLADLSAMDEFALTKALDELVASNLLVIDGGGYAFRHALVQEVAYSQLLPGERGRLHRRRAEQLTGDGAVVSDAVRAAERAHHWFEARELPEALEASVAAGLGAERVGALPEAAHHFERALGIWDNVADASERTGLDHLDLTLRTVNVSMLIGNFGRARNLIEAALRVIDIEADPVRAGLLYERLGRVRWDIDDDGAIECYEEAVRVVPAEPPTRARAFVLAAHGQILMLGGRFEEAIDACQEAIAVAEAAGARQPEGHARNSLGVSLAGVGQDDEGIAELKRALAIAREVEDVEDIGRAYVNLTEALNRASRFPESIDFSFEGLELVRRYGIDRTVGVYLTSNLVDALWVTGRWEEALEQADAIVARRPEGHWNYFNPGSLLAEMGRFDEAATVLAGVHLPEGGEAVFQGLADHADGLAALALWEGRPEDVTTVIEPALDRLPESYLHDRGGALFWRLTWASADLAERARARRDVDGEAQAIADAERAYGLLAGLVGRRGEHGSVPTPGCSAHRVLAAAEVERARGHADPAAWRAARDEWEALDVIYRSSYARYREAEARLALGDRDGAGAVLDGLGVRVRTLGAEPLAAAIEALAGRAGLTESAAPAVASGGAAGAPSLTSRERQVLELVTAGLSNGQIAERLFISTKTASVHVSNILAKLGVSSRTEAATLAVRSGLVEEVVG